MITVTYIAEFKNGKLEVSHHVAPEIGSPDEHTCHVFEKAMAGAILEGANDNVAQCLHLINCSPQAVRDKMLAEVSMVDALLRGIMREGSDETPPDAPEGGLSTFGILNGTNDEGTECVCPLCRETGRTYKTVPLTKGRKLIGIFGICKPCSDKHPDGLDDAKKAEVIETLLFLCPEIKPAKPL
jgi:hypothetical protein